MASPSRAGERELVYNRLPLLRADRRMSRTDLAEALGIHYQTVGYIERGEYSPSLHLALRIARLFDLPVEAVFSVEPFGQLGAASLLAPSSH
jgi:putative transcriptional regulator